MLQNYLLIPLGANILMGAAIVAIVGFTFFRVLTTVPVPSMVSPVRTSQIASKQNYFGVVAWVSRSMLKITDSYGVTRIFTLTNDTAILSKKAREDKLSYLDIDVLGHVRVSTVRNSSGEQAEVVTVL